MSPRETKDLILRQALLFFSKNDFERSSLNDIAGAIGVTKGAIYHYFDGKDDLFRACVVHLLDTMRQWSSEAVPMDIPLRVLLQNLFDLNATTAGLAQAIGLGLDESGYKNVLYLFLTAIKKYPDIQLRINEIYVRFEETLLGSIQRAIATGEIRPDTDAEALSFEVTAFIEGALLIGSISSNDSYFAFSARVFEALWNRIAIQGGTRDR